MTTDIAQVWPSDAGEVMVQMTPREDPWDSSLRITVGSCE